MNRDEFQQAVQQLRPQMKGLASVLTFHSWQQDECVAYFYGHKTTDRNVVMAEMRLSAETMTVDTEHNDVESLLNEMFNME